MKRYSFWLKTSILFMLLLALIHATGLFIKPVPTNDTERQLLDLMNNYKQDAGAGFTPTMNDLFKALSSCFSLLNLFGGLIFIFLLRKNASLEIVKGITAIAVVVFGICFLIMLILTFLPPVVLTGIIFISLTVTYILMPKQIRESL